MNIKPFTNKMVIDLSDFNKRGDHVTHGDVIIYRIDASDMPKNFDKLKDVDGGFLAFGEHTGHAHKLMENDYIAENKRPALVVIDGKKPTHKTYSLKRTADGEMYLRILEPTLLRHQEHKPFRLYPGDYEIDIQVERNPFDDEIRALRD